jgi:hypothetical protein
MTTPLALRNTVFLAIILISTFMHWPHFGKELISIHAWRQTQTQSTINSFYEEDMNIFNPKRNNRGNGDGHFRMEFPLMQWLVAGLYQIFGNHLIITRLFMFVVGLFSVFGMYKLLEALFRNSVLALMGAWAFNFSPSFYYYTINPLPDNFSLCFAIWGTACFFQWFNHKRTSILFLSSLCFSISALCKLPFIIYFIIPFVGVLLASKHQPKQQTFKLLVVGNLLAILPISWYVMVIPTWETNPVVHDMFDYKQSLHILWSYLEHNIISVLPELLLNYASVPFFLLGFYYLYQRKAHKNKRFAPIIGLCVLAVLYYLLEFHAIATIHDYYLFPFYPLLFMLVAYGAFHLYLSQHKAWKYVCYFLLALAPITCYLRMQVRWNEASPGFNKDLLEYKTQLRNAVDNNALVVAGNDISQFIFFYYIDKKGWSFNEDALSFDALNDMINKGAQYLYTDSEHIYNNTALAPLYKQEVAQYGSIKVIQLKPAQ